MIETILKKYVNHGIEHLYDDDPTLYGLLDEEYQRQANVLTMVAASSVADASVLICESMVPVNVTAEGYPGCRVIDKIEQLGVVSGYV